jgi:hypothetical protein
MRVRLTSWLCLLMTAGFTIGFAAAPTFGQAKDDPQKDKPAKASDKAAKSDTDTKSEKDEKEKVAPSTQSIGDPVRPTNDPILPVMLPDADQLSKNIKELSTAVTILTKELNSARQAAPWSSNSRQSDADDGPPEVDPPSVDPATKTDKANKSLLSAATLQNADLVTAGIDYPFRTVSAARKIHVIHFALTNDPTGAIGDGAKANVNFLNLLFTKQTENCRDRLKMTLIQGNSFDVQTVTNTLTALTDVTVQDTLIIYFSTHGGFDPSRNEHFFQTMPTNGRNGFYSRNKVLQQVKGKARLVVLMSDACTTPFVAPATAAAPAIAAVPTNALFDLMFYYQGIVNISSSTPPNPSYYYNNAGTSGGGVYTRGFYNASLYEPVPVDTPGGTNGWMNFYSALQRLGSINDPRGNQQPTWFVIP